MVSTRNTKAGATVTSTDALTTGTLTADTIQLSSNIIKASDGGSTITLDTSDNVTIAGDLTVSGNNLTFGNGEAVANTTDGQLLFTGAGTYSFAASAGSSSKLYIRGATGDAGLVLYNHTGVGNPEWSICFDDDDSDTLKFDAGTATVGGATKLSLTESGNMTIAGDLTISGGNITNALTLDSTLTVTNTSQLNNTLTVGVDGTGYDVKFFGDNAGNFMLYDQSLDRLEIRNTYLNNGLVLSNTDSGADNSPALSYYRNSASAADDDVLGITNYWGRSGAVSGGASSDARSPHSDYDDVLYARLQSSIIDATDGGEEGQFKIGVMAGGALRQNALVLAGTSTGGAVDLTLGNNTTSKVKISGYFAANNQTPAAAPDYTVSNKSGTSRSVDANGDIAAIGDNLAQLVDDLIAIGILQ